MYPRAGLWQTSVAAGTVAQGAVGWRFTQAYGFLEYAMNNLNPDEECRLVGNALGSVGFIGPDANPGDTCTVVLSGGNIPSPVTLVATVPAPGTGISPNLSLALVLAQQANTNASLVSAGMYAVAPYGTGAFAESAVPFPECGFVNPSSAFTIAVANTGLSSGVVTAQGAFLPPVAGLTPAPGNGQATTTFGYIPILNALESAHAQTSENLDTSRADVWFHDGMEIGKRTSLYRQWQQKLSDFMGTPINEQRFNRASSVGAVRYS
jgi:hypothetical protein